MDAGALRHRVTIQTATETSDGHDGLMDTWASTARRRISARVVALSGKDREQARQIMPLATHEVTLRWFASYVTDLVNGRARLLWHDGVIGDRTLEVVEAPREIESRVALQMLCKEAQ